MKHPSSNCSSELCLLHERTSHLARERQGLGTERMGVANCAFQSMLGGGELASGCRTPACPTADPAVQVLHGLKLVSHPQLCHNAHATLLAHATFACVHAVFCAITTLAAV
jgi:hypothetical protein